MGAPQQQPMQMGQPMVQPAVVAPMVQQQMPLQQPGMGAPPQAVQADEQAMAAVHNQQAQDSQTRRSAGGPFPKILKWQGPNGGDWKQAHPGFESAIRGRICPPWDPAKRLVSVESASHFYRSRQHPKGMSIQCAGPGCKFCQACENATANPDPNIQKMGSDWGKVRRQTLYNFINETDPASHIYDDGVMRPIILQTPTTLQDDFRMLFSNKGGVNAFCQPNGKPVLLFKKKTGTENINVEYKATDLDASPVDPYFYPAFHALWDLESRIRAPSDEDVMKALNELGLPLPMQVSAQVPASFNPTPQAPWPQPAMGAPQGMAQQMPMGPPQGMPQQPAMQQPQMGLPQAPATLVGPPQGPMNPVAAVVGEVLPQGMAAPAMASQLPAGIQQQPQQPAMNPPPPSAPVGPPAGAVAPVPVSAQSDPNAVGYPTQPVGQPAAPSQGDQLGVGPMTQLPF